MAEPKKLNAVYRFNRDEKASKNTISMDLIKAVFHDAIEYRGIPPGSRGMASTMGALCLGMALWSSWMILSTTDRRNIFMHVVDVIAVATIFAFGLYMFLKMIRIELFGLEDEPVIFDRKNMKIYRIFRGVVPGWKGLLKPWPERFVEYSWDLVDAVHHAELNVNHAGASRVHSLIFLVRKSHEDSSIIDGFSIGNGLVLGEVTVPPVWEHIRRFMEEKGLQLPAGEKVRVYNAPKRLRESIASSVTLYFAFWKEHQVLAILLTILFPITLPGAVVITLFSWASYRTATSIQWPRHVLDAIGDKLSDQYEAQ